MVVPQSETASVMHFVSCAGRLDIGNRLTLTDQGSAVTTSTYNAGRSQGQSAPAPHSGFALHDGLASVKQVVDSSQAVENSYSYEAFGQVTVGQSDIANPYLFVGGYGVQWESTPSLYFMQARYYSPSVGRFISEDPYGGSPQDPASLHRYLYCGNGPVNYVDPRGLIRWGGRFPWIHRDERVERVEPTTDPTAFEKDPGGRTCEYWHDTCVEIGTAVGSGCVAAVSIATEPWALFCMTLQSKPGAYVTCRIMLDVWGTLKLGLCVYAGYQAYRDCMNEHRTTWE